MAPHENRGSRRGGGGRGHQGSSSAERGSRGGGGPGRQVTVSKAMSWLLRHGAAKERIAMDGQGYVRVHDLLRWQKLRVLGVGMEELVAVVEGNEKKRFALRWVGGKEDETSAGARGKDVVDMATATTTHSNTDVSQSQSTPTEATQLQSQTETEAETETETQRAIQHAATDLDPSHYLIRATQGHSLKTLDASAYLAPITLADPKSVPETVVHGTFYGAWERILAGGGLKPMTRVHVHFATGPRLEDVLRALPLEDERGGGGQGEGGKEEEVSDARERKIDDAVVISGMRSDAQILIYVDIRRALAAGVEFWRSENGVVLTEGAVAAGTGAAGAEEEGAKGKILSSEFWDVVVDIKGGAGVLWRHGEGTVRDLPPELKGRGVPRGKERGGRSERGGGGGSGTGRSRGSAKPKLRVERGDGEDG